MVNPPLWKAVHEFAQVWRTSPPVQAMAAPLPGNVRSEAVGSGKDNLSSLLQECYASLRGVLHPLSLGSRIPWALKIRVPRESNVDERVLNEWVESAYKVELAHRFTLAWFRSRVAGYPILRCPQLAPNSPFTTDEFTNHYVWRRADLASGLQLSDFPSEISALLSIADEKQLANAARAMLAALQHTDEWKDFDASESALGGSSRTELRDCRSMLKSQLSEEAVNAHEPNLAQRRLEYREHQLKIAIESLSGAARQYAEKFSSLESLMELVCSDVFGQLVVFGDPKSISVTQVAFSAGSSSDLEFRMTDPLAFLYEPGDLLWIDSPISNDVIRLEAMSMNFWIADGEETHGRGKVLRGTGQSWR